MCIDFCQSYLQRYNADLLPDIFKLASASHSHPFSLFKSNSTLEWANINIGKVGFNDCILIKFEERQRERETKTVWKIRAKWNRKQTEEPAIKKLLTRVVYNSQQTDLSIKHFPS